MFQLGFAVISAKTMVTIENIEMRFQLGFAVISAKTAYVYLFDIHRLFLWFAMKN